MAHFHNAISKTALLLVAIGVPLPLASSQQPADKDTARAHAVQAMQRILWEQHIETRRFSEVMPLNKFLETLEQQLPVGKKLSLRIDKEAFGANFADVAATPIMLPPSPKTIPLGNALSIASRKIKNKHDYRIDGLAYIFTTPERALFTAAYDIRGLLAKPERIGFLAPPLGIAPGRWNAFRETVVNRNHDVTVHAARLVEVLVATLDGLTKERESFDHASIQVLNGSRLVIRANAENHSEVLTVLQALRRLGDLSIIVNAQLYEVDDAYYTKLKNAKPVDCEEEEKILLGQLPAKPSKGPSLFDLLAKQKPIQTGDEVKTDDGLVVTLLARQHAVSFLPNRFRPNRDLGIEQDQSRQSILEGVTFVAGIRVSPDRRFVRIQLTEKATEINQIKKIKVMVTGDGKQVEVDIPFTKDAAHRREFEIPDGGAMLLPVHYRPKSLQEKNRWWVLSLQPRIWIEEEEEQVRIGTLAEIVPLLVADVLKNPRLKATRDFYGTAGDARFALLDSAAWKWDKDMKIDVVGATRAPAGRTGQRLLGIRIERLEQADGAPAKLTVALVNAGGSDNGPVVGAGAIRYHARHSDKGWRVELAE